MKNTIKNLTLAFAIALAAVGCEKKPTLYVFNWSDYISESYIQQFEARHDCKVDVSSFDSNEAMFAKLKAGATGYDIIFPSSYQVEMLAKEDLLEKLDHTKIPNVLKNLDHSYDSQFLDKDCKYSVPYVVTYTGFLVAKDKVKDIIPNSWTILEDASMKGKITLLDDIREVIGAGLMANGYSLNSTSPKEIDIAVKTVLKWKENIRKFDAESYRTEVPAKSSWLAHGYSSDSFQAIVGDGEVREDLVFCLPKEGFTVAFDEMCILKTSQSKDLAYAFINELYETESAKDNMEYVCGAMPHSEALKQLDDNLKQLFTFSEDTMRRGQVLRSFTDKPEVNELYNKAWDKIKAMK